jgi:hypothetical protein
VRCLVLASSQLVSILQVNNRVLTGEFGSEGAGARNITRRASGDAQAPKEEVLDLMRHTDSVVEIQNTLRRSSPIIFAHGEAREL